MADHKDFKKEIKQAADDGEFQIQKKSASKVRIHFPYTLFQKPQVPPKEVVQAKGNIR